MYIYYLLSVDKISNGKHDLIGKFIQDYIKKPYRFMCKAFFSGGEVRNC